MKGVNKLQNIEMHDRNCLEVVKALGNARISQPTGTALESIPKAKDSNKDHETRGRTIILFRFYSG